MQNNGKIYQLLPKAAGAISAVAKTRTNSAQGYKFRGIDDFINAVHPILSQHGISVSTSIVHAEHRDHGTTKGGATQTLSIVRLSAKFYADDGSCLESQAECMGIDSGDKSANKAMSAAFKYILIQTFTVPTEDMAEADANDPEPSSKAPKLSPLQAAEKWALEHAVELETAGLWPKWNDAIKAAKMDDLRAIKTQIMGGK